jgi:hypothetical protein
MENEVGTGINIFFTVLFFAGMSSLSVEIFVIVMIVID